jgi:hypothetical protein
MYSKGAFPEAFNILDTGILAFAIAMSIVLATDSLIRHFATEDRSLTAISYFQEPVFVQFKDREYCEWPDRLSEVDFSMIILSHPIGSNL